MQKIIIKNFGPVQDAEIEIKKVLVLIGEQASGKSTIAKLIYFFNFLRYNILDKLTDLIKDPQSNDFDTEEELRAFIKEEFYKFFGKDLNANSFEIIYYYNFEKGKFLRLELNHDKGLQIIFNTDFFDIDFNYKLNNIKEMYRFTLREKDNDDPIINYQLQINARRTLFSIVSDLLEIRVIDLLFVIAGRSLTVSYSDLFEKYFFADVMNRLNQYSVEDRVDDKLIFDFIKRISLTKDRLKRFGNFKGLIERQSENMEIKEYLKKILSRINKIIKGEYFIDNDGEKIILDNQKKIYLNNASSGQQEVIRILQDIFIIFDQKSKVLRIIEEPEAHLFPVAQRELVELLALMVNYQPENQLIITTHSPYILTVFNHLLFSSRVVAKNPAAEEEVKEIVDKDCWLDPNEFSAYSLGNESFPEDNAKYCESIFDTEMGTLEQNYLDTVSEMLGWEFNSLYRIHGKTFKRK